ncbi:hypothetical protein [Halobellus sp. GM3]|uniref:hypothetical protein n=1 Tax=Halobellus sp. GM3 TaxID=3458410 RepID=UPI00403D6851
MASRRTVLVGLGGLVAGGGALIGTGAFTTVEAQRTVSVSTAGDANAFLALTPARGDSAYVDDSGDTIQINLDGTDSNNGAASGLNQNARTRFENLVQVANNGTQDVASLTFTFSVTGTNNDSGHEAALKITSGSTTIDADGSTNLLDSDLTPGNSVTFGVEVDLLDSGISDISDSAEIDLTITAETSSN